MVIEAVPILFAEAIEAVPILFVEEIEAAPILFAEAIEAAPGPFERAPEKVYFLSESQSQRMEWLVCDRATRPEKQLGRVVQRT